MGLIQPGVPIQISAARLLRANHNVWGYPKPSCCEGGEQIYPDNPSLVCESNMYCALLAAPDSQPALPSSDDASGRGEMGMEVMAHYQFCTNKT